MLKTKEFWGLSLIDANQATWQAWLKNFLTHPSQTFKLVFTPNPEQLILARNNKDFRHCLKKADLLIPDGIGLVKAAKLSARLTGVQTVEYLLKLQQQHGLKILLIGGRYNQYIQKHTPSFPSLRLSLSKTTFSTIYYTQGYQNVKSPTQNETKSIDKFIITLKPDIVLVAFGAPQQELWLCQKQSLLKQNHVRLALSVGGSFDFLLGLVKRAPISWQNTGFEWLWRLILQPSRLSRQLALPYFFLLTLNKKRHL
jgi:N-acetylglucosaminyldiphosphoundecaprenol N-acetyl-beta-D-mannosaminyltransferase